MTSLTPAQKELYDWLVVYINENQHPPSVRQMMKAMKLRSPAPVQSRLERLRDKGYVDWIEGTARTLKILHQPSPGLPVKGAIAAGGLVEPFADAMPHLDLSHLSDEANYYALRVEGNALIDDSLADGDVVIFRRLLPDETVNNGAIVSAITPQQGTILGQYDQQGDMVVLSASSGGVAIAANDVALQGVVVAVWRGDGH